jgi:hypothetical protein
MHIKDVICTRQSNFTQENYTKEMLGRNNHRCEDNIKINLREIE